MSDLCNLVLEKEDLEVDKLVNTVALIWEAIEITRLLKINQDWATMIQMIWKTAKENLVTKISSAKNLQTWEFTQNSWKTYQEFKLATPWATELKLLEST